MCLEPVKKDVLWWDSQSTFRIQIKVLSYVSEIQSPILRFFLFTLVASTCEIIDELELIFRPNLKLLLGSMICLIAATLATKCVSFRIGLIKNIQ